MGIFIIIFVGKLQKTGFFFLCPGRVSLSGSAVRGPCGCARIGRQCITPNQMCVLFQQGLCAGAKDKWPVQRCKHRTPIVIGANLRNGDRGDGTASRKL
jgi:hypothetical protein